MASRPGARPSASTGVIPETKIVGVAQAKKWIEDVTSIKLGTASLHDSLKSGILLCLMLNKLKEGATSVKKPSAFEEDERAAVCLENIVNYVAAAADLGIPELFAPEDLFNGDDMVSVVRHLYSLARSTVNKSKVKIEGNPPRPVVSTITLKKGAARTFKGGMYLQLPSVDEDGSGGGGGGDGGGDAGGAFGRRRSSDLGGGAAGHGDATPSERLLVLRDLIPQLLETNAQLKAKVLELEEKVKELDAQNKTLTDKFAEMSISSSKDAGDGLIIGNYNGKLAIQAGTSEKLVDALWNPNHQTSLGDYVATFLLTYRTFEKAKRVLELVLKRLKEAIADIANFKGKDVLVIELRESECVRITSFLQQWISLFYHDFDKDKEVYALMKDEVIPTMTQHNAAMGATLLKTFEREEKRASSRREREKALKAALEAALEDDDPSPEAQLRREQALQGRVLFAKGMSVTSGDDLHVFAEPSPTPLIPKGGFNRVTGVEQIPALELARQLTLIQFELFSRIRPHEFQDNAFSKKNKEELAPNICSITAAFNDIGHWVMYSLCTVPDLKKRQSLLKKFIEICDELRKLNNYNGVFSISAGLSCAPVHRLKKTWEAVYKDKKLAELWEYMLSVTDPQSSFGQYRKVKAVIEPPGIPYLGVYLQDLTFIQDGNSDKLENGFINFVKHRMVADVIKEVRNFQAKPYNLMPVTEITDYLQSARQLDEEKLYTLSLRIEPREHRGTTAKK